MEANLVLTTKKDKRVPSGSGKDDKAAIHPRNRLNTPRFRSAVEWAELGVSVQHDEGEIPRNERETVIASIESEDVAEVNTCLRVWQRRLERDGARPESIQTHSGSEAEFRWYLIPKSWVKKPYKSGKQELQDGGSSCSQSKVLKRGALEQLIIESRGTITR